MNLRVRTPVLLAAIVGGIDGAMVATIITCGYPRSPWPVVVANALGFGTGAFVIHGVALWMFFLRWNRFIAGESFRTGWPVVAMACFLVLFGLLMVWITIWAIGFGLAHGLPFTV